MTKYVKGNETLTIEVDEYAENPREWDTLGTCVFLGRYRSLGDTHNINEVEYANKIENKHISLPVYMYSHSGETISTTPFSCPWDSGKLGFIYITNEKARKEFGWKRITDKRKQQLLGYLENEIKTLDQYIRGEVYYYTHITPTDDDTVHGFYGSDFKSLFSELGENIEDWTEVEE